MLLLKAVVQVNHHCRLMGTSASNWDKEVARPTIYDGPQPYNDVMQCIVGEMRINRKLLK